MIAPMIITVAACVGLAAALLTAVLRRIALGRGLLDVPSARSSHSVPTPRGGGATIVLTVSVGCVGLWLRGIIDRDLLAALLGGVAVAAMGFADDRYQLHAAPRLAVHVMAALWALVWLGGLPALQLGDRVVSLGAAGYGIGMIAMVWVLNLFNFMDGIDGLAASEGVFVTWGATLLTVVAPVVASGVWPAAFVLGAACAGFLFWNWPPAKIFMGDVGSGYLGYGIAVLALAAARTDPVAVWVWLILGGLFWADATMTLVRRLLRGEPVHMAHRSHAYQWLARRWGQHRRVTLTAMGINLLWLLPWAAFAELHPRWALRCTLAALSPLLVLLLIAGAGRAERTTE
jgi:glycosyltransferase WbpL